MGSDCFYIIASQSLITGLILTKGSFHFIYIYIYKWGKGEDDKLKPKFAIWCQACEIEKSDHGHMGSGNLEQHWEGKESHFKLETKRTQNKQEMTRKLYFIHH